MKSTDPFGLCPSDKAEANIGGLLLVLPLALPSLSVLGPFLIPILALGLTSPWPTKEQQEAQELILQNNSDTTDTIPTVDEIKEKNKKHDDKVDQTKGVKEPAPEMTPDQIEYANQAEQKMREAAQGDGFLDLIQATIDLFKTKKPKK